MKPSPKMMEQKIRQMQPLIVLGMHRSGTSLMVRLLKDLGIYMGASLSRDAEAIYFQKLNRRIFHSVGVKWGYVDPLIQAMQSGPFVSQQTARMLRLLFPQNGFLHRMQGIAGYFGEALWEGVCRGEPLLWGWKDPRTTITFPVWLRIFPHARVLHVVRNGIDAAISTHRRSEVQSKKVWKRVLPLDYCPETLNFAYCFHLWETYVGYVEEHRHWIPAGHYLEVRYEDLLAESGVWLQEILSFAGSSASQEDLEKVSAQINRGRLNNAVYAEKYRHQIPALASSPLMQRLGYSYETAR